MENCILLLKIWSMVVDKVQTQFQWSGIIQPEKSIRTIFMVEKGDMAGLVSDEAMA